METFTRFASDGFHNTFHIVLFHRTQNVYAIRQWRRLDPDPTRLERKTVFSPVANDAAHRWSAGNSSKTCKFFQKYIPPCAIRRAAERKHNIKKKKKTRKQIKKNAIESVTPRRVSGTRWAIGSRPDFPGTRWDRSDRTRFTWPIGRISAQTSTNNVPMSTMLSDCWRRRTTPHTTHRGTRAKPTGKARGKTGEDALSRTIQK